MHPIDLTRLLVLGAIWGGSFPFIRVVAPALGPMATASLRMVIAGVALALYARIVRFDVEWRRFWKIYMIIGLVNSGLPFVLYSFAALHIPASYSVQALAACLAAAACYALAVIYIKKQAHLIKPMAVAAGGQLIIGVMMLPLLFFAPPPGPFTSSIALNLLGLALLCSALAYIIYYRLIMNVGPTQALMVTYLMPAFGMLWGALFLDEAITGAMIAGCALIVLGTALVVKRG
ncbi:MAG: protein of unknown function transrane [Deltaproteobacteria bacterium]|nr:protein of unknown function transrane [Deltaproteobacteria bacterium]